MNRVLALTALFVPAIAAAQVNTEQYRSDDVEGQSTYVEVDFGLKKGNVDLLSGGVDLGSTWTGEQNQLLLVVDGAFASKRTLSDYEEDSDTDLLSADARFINKILAHGRFNHDLGSRLSLEIFSQAEKNEFLLMDRRLLAGVGPRMVPLDSEQISLAMGLAYMLEHERLHLESIDPAQQDRDTLAHRGTSYLSGSVTIADASSLGGTVYIQPRMTDISDFRALGELQMSVSISEVLALGIEFSFRHDSQPPVVSDATPDLMATDLAVTQSLSLTF